MPFSGTANSGSSHGKANAAHQKQSRFIADLAVPLNLTCRNAFLAGSCSPEGITPMFKRNAGCFINVPNAHSVLLAAPSATPKIPHTASAIPVQHFVNFCAFTMRAGGLIAPPLPLHELHSGIFISAGQWQGFNRSRLFYFRVSSQLFFHGNNMIHNANSVKGEVALNTYSRNLIRKF